MRVRTIVALLVMLGLGLAASHLVYGVLDLSGAAVMFVWLPLLALIFGVGLFIYSPGRRQSDR